ncbi:hypothetical protein V3F56_00215 [Moorellaceae bacterium AZ2]
MLGHGTPRQVKDEIKRRIDEPAPGGGFAFTTVHNVQPDAPPGKSMVNTGSSITCLALSPDCQV